ncbi:MAG: hypothetical protein EOO74_02495, partial [Myxococcales bacterium]
MTIDFTESGTPHTLGVEWEFALVDRVTRDLSNSADALFAAHHAKYGENPRLHKELLRNSIEITTG